MFKRSKSRPFARINFNFPTLSKFENDILDFTRTRPVDRLSIYEKPVVPGYLSELFCNENPFMATQYRHTNELKDLEKQRKDFNREKIRNYSVTENVNRDTRIKFNAKYSLKNFQYILNRNEMSEAKAPIPSALKPVHNLKTVSNYDFIFSKREVCLLDLAGKITQKNIAKLDEIVEKEEKFIKKENQLLQKEKKENEEYLKSVCQRTYKIVRRADKQVLRKEKVIKKLKRAKFVSSKLNTECIQLEEELENLKNLKLFLKKSFHNKEIDEICPNLSFLDEIPLSEQLRELGRQDSAPEDNSAEGLEEIGNEGFFVKNNYYSVENPKSLNFSNKFPQLYSFSKEKLEDLKSLILSDFGGNSKREVSSTKPIFTELSKSFSDDLEFSEDSFSSHQKEMLRDPMDLVAIVTNLEIKNLSLIENVQEQEEMCDLMKKKILDIKMEMDKQTKDIDESIQEENKKIEKIVASIENLQEKCSSLDKFYTIERYKAFFCLKGFKKSHLDDLLEYIVKQINVLDFSIFDNQDSDERGPLEMLRQIESLVDSLYIDLQRYDKKTLILTKKRLDECKRQANRARLNKQIKETRAEKLKKVMESFNLPPRYVGGRKVMYRSQPLQRSVHCEEVNLDDIRQQEEIDYFFT